MRSPDSAPDHAPAGPAPTGPATAPPLHGSWQAERATTAPIAHPIAPDGLIQVQDADWMPAVGAIFREYAQSLSVDLCFQNFDAELADLPGEYAAPRGALWLALHQGQVAGCCAMRPLDSVDYPNACEMKRLYVRPAYRGMRLGHQLAEAVMDSARLAGYDCILLDTLDEMEAARGLYEEIGFEEIPPYYHNPIAGAHYLKADL